MITVVDLMHYQMVGENILETIFGVDNIQSEYTGNKKIGILVLGKASSDWLDDTSTTAEAEYSINITKSKKHLV